MSVAFRVLLILGAVVVVCAYFACESDEDDEDPDCPDECYEESGERTCLEMCDEDESGCIEGTEKICASTEPACFCDLDCYTQEADGCGGGADEAGELTFGSSAFDDGDTMPDAYTCKAESGNGVSPPLSWSNPPEGTAAWAITMVDKDAVDYGHWGIANIPAGVLSLDEGISPGGTLPTDAFEVLNDSGDVGYEGPCPPEGEDAHKYEFMLWALSDEITGTADMNVHTLYEQVLAVAIGSTTITVHFAR